MTNVSINNTLSDPLVIWDSYQNDDDPQNYYGTLTRLGDLGAGASTTVPAPHPASTLIVRYPDDRPLARFVAGLSHTSFVVSDQDVAAMAQATAFVAAAAQHPDSADAKQIAGLKTTADINAFFASRPDYALVTTATYMLALTYRAANPAPAGTPFEDRTYSLATLVTMLTGQPYPEAMPDLAVRGLFFDDKGGVVRFGGTIDVTEMPLAPELVGPVLPLLATAGQTHVEVIFDTNIGLNVLGTRIDFSTKEIDVPLGGSAALKIVSPRLSFTINPLFKFVIAEISGTFPFTILGQALSAKVSMIVDNVEIEVGVALDLEDTASVLRSLPNLRGVHFDHIGVGMGIIFEPPGYALGLQGAFHIGEDENTVVAIDDDQFAVVVDLECEVPNVLYLSFYVPRLDLSTLLTALTDVSIDIDLPIEFSDLSFRWSENPLEPLALPDGTLSAGGYGFSGYLDLVGLSFYADVSLSLDKVAVQATMGPLDLAGIFRLTGPGTGVTMKFDAAGNPIRNNKIPKTAAARAAVAAAQSKEIVPPGGPSLHLGTDSTPYVLIGADATLFGVSVASIDIVVDDNGLRFALDLPLARVSCRLSGSDGLVAGFSYGPDFTVPLPGPLGSVHLQSTVEFGFTVHVSPTTITFFAQGAFGFMGHELTFGPVGLALDVSGLEGMVDACRDAVVSAVDPVLGPIVSDGLAWAKAVVDDVVSEVDNIAEGLKDFFQHTIDEASGILAQIGVDPNDAGRQLSDAYAGVSAVTLAGALVGPFGLSGDPDTTAQILRGVGFPAEDVAPAISGVFDLPPGAVSVALQAAGFETEVVTSVIDSLTSLFR